MSDPKKHEGTILEDPEVWVERYGNYLYRFALARTKDSGVAEDLVQETFVAALQARDRFKGRSTPKSWLVGILKHKIVDHFRKSFREQASDEIEARQDAEAVDTMFSGDGHWNMMPARWRANPDDAYNQKEFLDIFYRCLSELPKRLADAFLMREVDGMSTEEVCKVLGISATNSWVILYRARMGLRRCLEIKWLDAAG